MTSKEALDELEWFINCVYDSVEDGHAAYLKDEVESASNAYDKLEKDLEVLEEYRKIEEEIGVDFSTLSKILKQRFVYDNNQVKIELLGLHIKSDELYLYGFVEDTMQAVYLRLKDYGKTWVLDKEEFYKNIK